MAFACRTVADKMLAILLPISAFVATGCEHSVANMYFIPVGMMLQGGHGAITWQGFAHNLAAVTLGNIVGGAVFVGLAYYAAFRRRQVAEPPAELAVSDGCQIRKAS